MKMKKHFTIYLFHVKKALVFGAIWIKQVLKVEIVLSPSSHFWELETRNYLVNILSITAKYYIFQCSRKHIKLIISGFVNNMHNEQKYLSKMEMRRKIFMKK